MNYFTKQLQYHRTVNHNIIGWYLKNSCGWFKHDYKKKVQEKGFYNANNFSSNFKKAKYAAYFKSALEPQGVVQPISQEGEKALAELISSLTD